MPIKAAEWIRKRKRLIGANNIPNNRKRRTGLTTSSSTRIRLGTIPSSSIQDRTSTMSKTTSRSVTSRRNPVQHCHGIRSSLQSMRSGTDSAASSVRVIPAVVCGSGSKGKEEVRRRSRASVVSMSTVYRRSATLMFFLV